MARTVASRKRSRANSGSRRVRRKTYGGARGMLARRIGKRTRRRTSALRKSLPDFTNVALKFTQSFATGFSTSPSVGYDFNLNSLHDFNASGGTGQPFGYDQYSAFFQECSQSSSRLRFTIHQR